MNKDAVMKACSDAFDELERVVTQERRKDLSLFDVKFVWMDVDANENVEQLTSYAEIVVASGGAVNIEEVGIRRRLGKIGDGRF
jgi:hypothetical protein